MDRMAMSKAQKNALVTHRVQLVNNIYLNEEVYAYMRAGSHMTDSMEQEIKVRYFFSENNYDSVKCYNNLVYIVPCDSQALGGESFRLD